LHILLFLGFLLGFKALVPVSEGLLGLLAEDVFSDVEVVSFLFYYGADF
jgi:hypothetical protein